MAVTTNGTRISRDDLEAAYSRVMGEGGAVAQGAKSQLGVVLAAGALVVVTVAYLAGRRRGRRRASIVVRRV